MWNAGKFGKSAHTERATIRRPDIGVQGDSWKEASFMDFSGSKLSSRLLARCHINKNLVCPRICFDMERSYFYEREKLARGLKWLVDIAQHGSE